MTIAMLMSNTVAAAELALVGATDYAST